MEKFKKYMDILEKGLKAIGIAFLVVSVVMAVLAVIGFIGIPNVEIGGIGTTLEFGVLELDLVGEDIMKTENVNNLLACSSLLISFQFAISYILVKILKDLVVLIKTGEIFSNGVVKAMRNLAVCVAVGGFFSEVINHLGSYLIISAYDVSALFNSQVVKDYFFNFEIQGDFVVYAAMIYLLSYVFKYGAELQTQVDETL